MTLEKVLPPHVKGKLSGHLTVRADEIFWVRSIPGEVIVELQWWGDDTIYTFRPEVINNVKATCKEEDTTVIFNVRTSQLLFESYLKKCDKLVFRIRRMNGDVVGAAVVSDLPQVVFKSPRSGEYYPVFDNNGSRIGDLNVAFETWFLHKDQDLERRKKLPTEKLLSLPPERKQVLTADKERLVAKAMDCGERLRDAMTMSVIEDTSVNNVEKAFDPTVAQRPTTDADVVNYLLSEKDLSVEEEADVIRSLQGMSPRKGSSRQCCGQLCGHSSRIGSSSQAGAPSDRPDSSESSSNLRNALELVNCYRLLIHCLHLSQLGLKKVSCVEKKDGKRKGPPGVCYMVEMLPPITKKPVKPWIAATHRFVSRKVEEGKVVFGESGATCSRIGKGKAWEDVAVNLDGARFKVYWRYLNQRLPSLLGVATINSSDIKMTGVLSTFIVPVTTNSGGVSGHLSFVVELGKDKKTFGPHLIYCDGGRVGGSGSRWSDCECRCCRLVCGERGPGPPSVAGVVCRPLSAPQTRGVPPHRARAFAMRSASSTSYTSNGDILGYGVGSASVNQQPVQQHIPVSSSGIQSAEPVLKPSTDPQAASIVPHDSQPNLPSQHSELRKVVQVEETQAASQLAEPVRKVKDAVVQVDRPMTDSGQQTTPDSRSAANSSCPQENSRIPEFSTCRACCEKHTCGKPYDFPCQQHQEPWKWGSRGWSEWDRGPRTGWEHYQCCCCSPVRPASASLATSAVCHEITVRVDCIRGFPSLAGIPSEDIDCFVDYIFPTVVGDGLVMPGRKYSTEVAVVPSGGRDVGFGSEFIHSLTLPADISLTRALARLPLPSLEFNMWARVYRGSSPCDSLIAKGILNVGQLGSMEMEFLKEGRRTPVHERIVLPLLAVSNAHIRSGHIPGDIVLSIRYRSRGGERTANLNWAEPVVGEFTNSHRPSGAGDFEKGYLPSSREMERNVTSSSADNFYSQDLRSSQMLDNFGPNNDWGEEPRTEGNSRCRSRKVESERTERDIQRDRNSDRPVRSERNGSSPVRPNIDNASGAGVSEKRSTHDKSRSSMRSGRVEKTSRMRYMKQGDADILQLDSSESDKEERRRIRRMRDQALSPITETSILSPRPPAWTDSDTCSDQNVCNPEGLSSRNAPLPSRNAVNTGSTTENSPRDPIVPDAEPLNATPEPSDDTEQYPEATGEHFKAKVEIERAINLPRLEGASSCYATFEAVVNGRRRPMVTKAVGDVTNPIWNSSFDVSLPVDYLKKVDGGGLVVRVVRGREITFDGKDRPIGTSKSILGHWKESESTKKGAVSFGHLDLTSKITTERAEPGSGDCKVVIDVAALAAGFPAILGWFPLILNGVRCTPIPTIKLKITPLEDVSRFKPLWAKEYCQWKSARGESKSRPATSSSRNAEMSPASRLLLEKVLQLEKVTAGLKAEIRGKKQAASNANRDLIDLTGSSDNGSPLHETISGSRRPQEPPLSRPIGLYDSCPEPIGSHLSTGRIDQEIAAAEARYGTSSASAHLSSAGASASRLDSRTFGARRPGYNENARGKPGAYSSAAYDVPARDLSDTDCHLSAPGGYSGQGYSAAGARAFAGVSCDSGTDSPREQPGTNQSTISISSREEDSLEQLMRPTMVDRTANIPFCTDEEFEKLQAEFLNTPASEINRIIRGLENL